MAGFLTIHSSEGHSSIRTGDYGHSWIEYKPDGGVADTYGTFGTRQLKGLYTNQEPKGAIGNAHRTVRINDEQEKSSQRSSMNIGVKEKKLGKSYLHVQHSRLIVGRRLQAKS